MADHPPPDVKITSAADGSVSGGKKTEPDVHNSFQKFRTQADDLQTYYKSALHKRRRGVYVALVIASTGFLFFAFSVYLLWAQWNKTTSDKHDIIESVKNNAAANAGSNVSIVNAAIANANTASVNAATASVICGVLLEFVALATFYFDNRDSTDLKDRLDINQRFLLANIICEGMNGEPLQKAQAKLVEGLLEYGLENQEQQGSEKDHEAGAVGNNSSASQSPEKQKRRN